jgi:signal transduction histidine kinase
VSAATRRLRRTGPAVALGLLVLLSGVSLWQAWQVARHLNEEARASSRIYGRVIGALANPSPDAGTDVLLELVSQIRATGMPVVVSDTSGRVTAADNLPFEARLSDPRIVAYARELDRINPPVSVPDGGRVHFGALPARQQLQGLAVLQVALLLSAIAAGVWAFRSARQRDRDRLWVAMARESAHQLGTPLMSAEAWVDRLREGGDPVAAADHLKADLERLHRVAQRFERIGRPARRERVPLGALVERVARYFAPRLPSRSHTITLRVDAPDAGPHVPGDSVLLEWALEALVRNAIDALSGRDGTIDVVVAVAPPHARVVVRDDGPGIPPGLRARIFEPGVSTKQGGWGIGLALARRIVEDVHGGRLVCEAPERGAAFTLEVPLQDEHA